LRSNISLKRGAALIAILAAAGCGGGDDSTPSTGTIQKVEALGEEHGIEFTNPASVAAGPDGAVYVLDRGSSALYRLRGAHVDTLARSGGGPGELKQPSAMAWWRDSVLVVVDEGNGRLQFFAGNGHAQRTLAFGQGAMNAVIDPEHGRLYVSDFGRNFALVADQAVLKQDSLVSVVDLADGRIVGRFGTPRAYAGKIVPILGNYVSLARNAGTGDIWISWPLEPVMARYAAGGARRGELTRTLPFKPPAAREIPNPNSPLPLPRADVQRVTYSTTTDAEGRLLVLAAREAKRGIPGDPDYVAPPQAVDVLSSTGRLLCTIALPVTGDFISSESPGTLLLADGSSEAEVYRITYTCPASQGRVTN
jgi:hypothetical protein